MSKKQKLSPEVKLALDEKMDVLSEMTVVTPENQKEIRSYFENSIAAQPDRDPYVIMDQIAKTYIEKHLNGYEDKVEKKDNSKTSKPGDLYIKTACGICGRIYTAPATRGPYEKPIYNGDFVTYRKDQVTHVDHKTYGICPLCATKVMKFIEGMRGDLKR